MVKKVLIVCLALFVIQIVAEEQTAASSDKSIYNSFAKDLFKTIIYHNLHVNVIYSPVAIQSCLTLAFMGADGHSADELQSALKLGSDSKTEIAKNYGDFLKSEFNKTTNGSEDKVILKLANRIYVNNFYELESKFNETASHFFESGLELISFADGPAAVEKINTWVEDQTANKIIDILSSDAIDSHTSTVLVNAIYFKGKWKIPFDMRKTYKDSFKLSSYKSVEVDYMTGSIRHVGYADLKDLNAKALQLPFKNSDLFMLIILPNKVNGLKQLENALTHVDLNELSEQLTPNNIEIHLPKFKIEFDLDLIPILQTLGIKEIFSNRANFSKIFANSNSQQKVSKVQHKAYLDINEGGAEAAATTIVKVSTRVFIFNTKQFLVNHPFVFAIRNDKAVFFAGHVVKF